MRGFEPQMDAELAGLEVEMQKHLKALGIGKK